MLILLTFILISYGASNIMVFSSIFVKWREFWDKISPNFFGKLFSCMMCLPFWWGVIISLCGISPTGALDMVSDVSFFGLFVIPAELIITFFDACLSSGIVWLVHTLQEKLEK